MPISPFLVFSATASSGTTAVSFDVGGAYDSYMLLVPAMASATTLAFEVSDSATGTYYPLYHAPTSASAPTLVQIPSGTTNCAVGIPSLGRYFKVAQVNPATSTAYTFKVLCKAT